MQHAHAGATVCFSCLFFLRFYRCASCSPACLLTHAYIHTYMHAYIHAYTSPVRQAKPTAFQGKEKTLRCKMREQRVRVPEGQVNPGAAALQRRWARPRASRSVMSPACSCKFQAPAWPMPEAMGQRGTPEKREGRPKSHSGKSGRHVTVKEHKDTVAQLARTHALL